MYDESSKLISCEVDIVGGLVFRWRPSRIKVTVLDVAGLKHECLSELTNLLLPVTNKLYANDQKYTTDMVNSNFMGC